MTGTAATTINVFSLNKRPGFDVDFHPYNSVLVATCKLYVYPSHRRVVFRNYLCKYIDINYDYVHVETWGFYSKYEAPRYSNIATQTCKFYIDDSYGGYDDNKDIK